MTNGDAIRQMSDDELFSNFLYATRCEDCDFWRKCASLLQKYAHSKPLSQSSRCSVCHETWISWLGSEQEAEDGD